MIIPKENEYYRNFQGHDRFDVPEPVYRVTGGYGGEAFLIIGSEKTAIHDCGMACYSRETISNIHELLDPLGRKLDYIFMSHTHYDHIGALPYIIDEWPEITVCGAEKAAKVFNSDVAKQTMRELGDNAAELYDTGFGHVKTDPLRIDLIMKEGDEVSLGDISVVFYEAKGHTDCSASYMLLPQKILFLSDSIGQYERPGKIATASLKSFRQAIDAAKKMAGLGANILIGMHYGMIPPYYNDKYFEEFIDESKWEWTLIRRLIDKGMTDDEISDIHDIFYWDEEKVLIQPYEAHHLNTMIIIKNVRKEMEAEDGKL